LVLTPRHFVLADAESLGRWRYITPYGENGGCKAHAPRAGVS
jgi:hypothetical protein